MTAARRGMVPVDPAGELCSLAGITEALVPPRVNTIFADALTAAILFAVDPVGLGGVSLRARVGPLRERWLASVRELFPPASPFRRLPLHAGDEAVLGGLDLPATLRAGRPVMQKGLLAEADGGLVILAMAERVEPTTAARVAGVMDTGCAGMPPAPARFGVIALDEGIDPDEHTPPALLDRLAFHIDLTLGDPRECEPAAHNTAAISAARAMLPSVSAGNGAVEALCATALALGIASVRAPLFALRAARAAAALDGRAVVTGADVIVAARLVLGPRATCLPPTGDDETSAEPEPQKQADRPDATVTPADRPMADVVLDAARAALPPDLLARLMAGTGGPSRARRSGRAGQSQASNRTGRPIGARMGQPKGGARLHVLETLKAASPWQKLRRAEAPSATPRIVLRPDDFRIVRFRRRSETTTVFAIDASGSTALHRLGEAKGAVELLLADCYVRRDQVALVAFRGRDAILLLPPTGSLVRAKRCLASLPGGGATPLAAGIDAAVALASAERRRGRTPVIVLLTDGRANMTQDGAGGRPRAEAEALAAAQVSREAGLTALLVDTSPRPNPFARHLAETMAAQHVALPHANAASLSRAVRSVVAS